MKDLKDFQRVLDNYGIAYTVGSKGGFEATLSRLDELMESVFFSKDEPQTEKPKIRKRNDKPFRAVWLDDDHNEIGTTQTEREGE